MRNGSQSFQTDLCGGAFYRVNGAKQFVDLFRIVVAFKRDKAIADDLKVFLRFRLEELQYLIRNLVVRRQRIEVRACCRSDNRVARLLLSESLPQIRLGLGKVQRWCFRWKRKPIALFENRDIIDTLLACVADFQK